MIRGEILRTQISASDIGLKEGFLLDLNISPETVAFPMNGTSTAWINLRSLIEKDLVSVHLTNSPTPQDYLPREEQEVIRTSFLESWPSKIQKGKISKGISNPPPHISFLFSISP